MTKEKANDAIKISNTIDEYVVMLGRLDSRVMLYVKDSEMPYHSCITENQEANESLKKCMRMFIEDQLNNYRKQLEEL